MTWTERLLSVTRAYQASPSLQTTTLGPTARAAGIVTLVRGAACAEGSTEKESREARAVGLAVASDSFSCFKAHGKWSHAETRCTWAGHVGRDLLFRGKHSEFEGWPRRTLWIGLRQRKDEGPRAVAHVRNPNHKAGSGGRITRSQEFKARLNNIARPCLTKGGKNPNKMAQ